jgi:hypothetical protein
LRYVPEGISIRACIEIAAAGESFVLIPAIHWPSDIAAFEADIGHGRARHALSSALTAALRDEPQATELRHLAAGLVGQGSFGWAEPPEMVLHHLQAGLDQRRILAFHCGAWVQPHDRMDAEGQRMLHLVAEGPSGDAAPSTVNFHGLSLTERCAALLRAAAPHLPAGEREAFGRLLGPEALGTASDVMQHWCVSPVVPSGSVARLLSMLAPGGMWGVTPYAQASLLNAALAGTRDARSLQDLDVPARRLALAVGQIGVGAFAELLARLRRRVRPVMFIPVEAVAPGPEKPAPRVAVAPASAPESEMEGVDEVALAQMLREAARLHVPFCIPCMLNKLKNAA